jgi:hypothetical protein
MIAMKRGAVALTGRLSNPGLMPSCMPGQRTSVICHYWPSSTRNSGGNIGCQAGALFGSSELQRRAVTQISVAILIWTE